MAVPYSDRQHSFQPQSIYCESEFAMAQGYKDRVYTRYPFSASAEIIDGSNAEMPSRVINIGFGGGRLLANGRLRVGADVTVKVRTPSDYFEAPAGVIHSTATDVGVAFHNVAPEFLRVLSRWIGAARSAPASTVPPAGVQPPSNTALS